MFLRTILTQLILVACWAGSSAGQIILLDDDFEDGSSLGWQTFSSGWLEADGVYHDTNTAANTPVSSVWQAGYSWQDYGVSGDVKLVTLTGTSDAGIVFRFQSDYPTSSFCVCRLANDIRGRNLQLLCLGGNVFGWRPYAFTTAQFYRLTASAVGQTVTCEIDGEPETLLEGTLVGGNTTGTVGFRGTHIKSDYDNVVVVAAGISAEEAIADLIAAVIEINLHHGIENALDAKLEAALAAVDSGDEAGTVDSLNAFIHLTCAQKGKKISVTAADELIQQATSIIEDILGGTAARCE